MCRRKEKGYYEDDGFTEMLLLWFPKCIPTDELFQLLASSCCREYCVPTEYAVYILSTSFNTFVTHHPRHLKGKGIRREQGELMGIDVQ